MKVWIRLALLCGFLASPLVHAAGNLPIPQIKKFWLNISNEDLTRYVSQTCLKYRTAFRPASGLANPDPDYGEFKIHACIERLARLDFYINNGELSKYPPILSQGLCHFTQDLFSRGVGGHDRVPEFTDWEISRFLQSTDGRAQILDVNKMEMNKAGVRFDVSSEITSGLNGTLECGFTVGNEPTEQFYYNLGNHFWPQ
jgi:hypothetical protein